MRSLSGLCVPGTVDELQVPGFNQGTQFFRAGADIHFDSRDNMFRPSSGALIELGADWSHGFGFDRLATTCACTPGCRRCSTCGSARARSWCASRSTTCEPIGKTPVPFSELIVLGGPDTFRGFRYGRFRNFSSLFAGIEYRWPVWMWMDASLFGEYGGVFGHAFEGFELRSACGPTSAPACACARPIRSSRARRSPTAGATAWQFFFSVNTGF